MSTEHLQTGTWRRGKSLVSWNFDLRRAPGDEPHDAVRRATRDVVGCLTGFATPNRVKWTTESGGENVAVLAAPDITIAALAQVAALHPDVVQVLIGLDLLCVDVDRTTEVVLADHGLLMISLEESDDPADPAGWTVYVFFTIDTDIYAARTLAPDPDNRALAAVNGPRLRGFLERLRGELGATLYDLEAGSYRDQVTALGFEAPSP